MEKQKPLVSVVITFLNEERFLPEAVNSVLAQTYTNWEMILVDDGSSDGSVAIAKNYEQQYPGKIFYQEHPGHTNHGLSASRNAGIARSNGTLLAFLDADDVWLPEKLELQVNIHLQHPKAGLIAEGSLHWYNWNDPEKQNCIVPIGVPGNHLYAPRELTKKLYPLGSGATPGPCAWMLTRAAIDRVGGFESSFKGELQLYEDQAFLCKIYLQEYVYMADTCNNWYRQRPGSIMKWVNDKGKYHHVRKHFLNWMASYLEQRKIEDKEVSHLLQKAMFPYKHPTLYSLMTEWPEKIKEGIKKVIPGVVKRSVRKILSPV